MNENLFERTPGEWTDDQIRVGLMVLAEFRDAAVASGEFDVAEQANDVMCVLADERDARVELYRAVDGAL